MTWRIYCPLWCPLGTMMMGPMRQRAGANTPVREAVGRTGRPMMQRKTLKRRARGQGQGRGLGGILERVRIPVQLMQTMRQGTGMHGYVALHPCTSHLTITTVYRIGHVHCTSELSLLTSIRPSLLFIPRTQMRNTPVLYLSIYLPV